MHAITRAAIQDHVSVFDYPIPDIQRIMMNLIVTNTHCEDIFPIPPEPVHSGNYCKHSWFRQFFQSDDQRWKDDGREE